MELDDNKLYVTDENGHEHVYPILFTYHHDEREKDYVVFLDDDDEAVAAIYVENEDGSGDLFPIEDDEEYEEVLEVFNAFQDEEDTSEEN